MWNKYAYVLNNPLANIDLDGREVVTMQFDAFIPYANVGGFRGDNRSFSSNPNASSRVSVTVRVETDPAKNHGNPMIGKPDVHVSPTHNNLCNCEKTSGPKPPEVTATQGKNGDVTVNIQENMRNPFTPVGSGIQSNVNITVNQDATQANINGTVSGSPSFETNLTVDGGRQRMCRCKQRLTGATILQRINFGVGLQETKPVDKTVQLPKKKDDQK